MVPTLGSSTLGSAGTPVSSIIDAAASMAQSAAAQSAAAQSAAASSPPALTGVSAAQLVSMLQQHAMSLIGKGMAMAYGKMGAGGCPSMDSGKGGYPSMDYGKGGHGYPGMDYGNPGMDYGKGGYGYPGMDYGKGGYGYPVYSQGGYGYPGMDFGKGGGMGDYAGKGRHTGGECHRADGEGHGRDRHGRDHHSRSDSHDDGLVILSRPDRRSRSRRRRSRSRRRAAIEDR